VIILEKVWAKMFNSYANIVAGHTVEALHDLTGAPTKSLLPEYDDVSEIW